MSYDILPYTKKKASQLGVTVKPSKKADKKIDVFKQNKLVASIGARGYQDYPHYLKEKGKAYADNRRDLYRARHKNDIGKKESNGWYANNLLW